MKSILQSSVLVLLLLFLFAIVEPPISPIAWLLMTATFVLVVFIVVSSYRNRKKDLSE